MYLHQISVLAILFCILIACSERTIKMEKLQKRGGIAYAINEEEPYSGKVIEFYDSGQKKQEKNFENGKLHSAYVYWYPNGSYHIQGNYINNKKDGFWQYWHKNGQKEKECNYNNDKMNGLNIEWFPNGQKRIKSNYTDDELVGKYTSWYENGQKKATGKFNDSSIKAGIWQKWYKNGQKKIEGKYNNSGEKTGHWLKWYKNGQQKIDGVYNNGLRHGKWRVWYINGQLANEGVYNNGDRTHKWNFWNPDGKIIATDSVVDIDGNSYLTVKIGEQWWMVENLKVIRYRNGDSLKFAPDSVSWKFQNSRQRGAYCSYQNEWHNLQKYGNLYNWHAVNDKRILAPQGWRIPTKADYDELENYVEEEPNKLIIIGGNHGGTNETGFSALFGGYRNSNGDFYGSNNLACFWISNSYNWDSSSWIKAYSLRLYKYGVYLTSIKKDSGLSIRCIKN